MLSKDTIHDLTQRVLKLSSAEETEVIVSGGTHSLTRFANNTIHQNVSDENYAISVRTVLGPDEGPLADRAIDEGVRVFKWHRRLAGDARKRNPLLWFIYKGA